MKSETKSILKQLSLGLLVFVFVGVAISSVWFGSRISSLNISSIQIEGGETISHEYLKDEVERILEGEYLDLVPRSFVWFYPQDEIKNKLQEINRLYGPTTEIIEGNILRVTFEEYAPFALWCDEVGSEKCVFLDTQGFAFAHAPSLTGGSFLRFISSDSVVKISDTPFVKKDLDQVSKTVELLENEGWFISHAEIDQARDIFLQIVGGSEMKITLTETPSESVDNFLTIVNSEEFSHLAPGNFQYIDLRFGKKVFVNEELEADIASTTIEGE